MSYTTLNEELQKVKTASDLRSLNPIAVKLLYYGYAEWESFALPDGAPPYKELTGPADTAYDKLITPRTLRMIENFKNESLPRGKREQLFITMLESLPADEAKLLIAIKDKKVSEMFPLLTRDFIDSTFPTLLVLPEGKAL